MIHCSKEALRQGRHHFNGDLFFARLGRLKKLLLKSLDSYLSRLKGVLPQALGALSKQIRPLSALALALVIPELTMRNTQDGFPRHTAHRLVHRDPKMSKERLDVLPVWANGTHHSVNTDGLHRMRF